MKEVFQQQQKKYLKYSSNDPDLFIFEESLFC